MFILASKVYKNSYFYKMDGTVTWTTRNIEESPLFDTVASACEQLAEIAIKDPRVNSKMEFGYFPVVTKMVAAKIC